MQYQLIINPHAGNKPQDGVLHLAIHHFPDLLITETKKQGDATRLAKESKADVVIAAGGDGTLNEVIQGIVQRKKKPLLGVLPIGTANMFARHLKIPLEADAALQCIKEHHTRLVDIGTINDKIFMNSSGVGLDAEIFKNVQPELKKLFGQASYHMSGLKTFFTYDQKELLVKTKDLEFKGYYVIICNVGQYGPINIAPQAKIDDGKLDVLIFGKKQIFDTFRYLAGVFTQGHTLQKDVQHIQTTQLTVTAKQKVLCHADAELAGSTPVKIQILPKAVEVLCPHITSPKEYITKGISQVGKVIGAIKKNGAKKLKRVNRTTEK